MAKKKKGEGTKPSKPRNKGGRPKVEIPWDKVDRWLQAEARGDEVAERLGIDPETFYKRVQKDKKCTFTAYRQRKIAQGNSLLREAQFTEAMKGNTTMQIFLGKNRLGQKDRFDHHVDVFTSAVNVQGEPIKEEDLDRYEDDYLEGEG